MLPQNIEHVAKLNAVLICPMKSDMNAPMKLKLHPAERLIIVPNIIFSLIINHLLSFFRKKDGFVPVVCKFQPMPFSIGKILEFIWRKWRCRFRPMPFSIGKIQDHGIWFRPMPFNTSKTLNRNWKQTFSGFRPMPFNTSKTPLHFNPILWHRLLSQLKISQTNIRLDTAVANLIL